MIEIKQIKGGKRVLTVEDERNPDGGALGQVKLCVQVSDCTEVITPEAVLDVIVMGVNYSGIVVAHNKNLIQRKTLGEIKPDRVISKRGFTTYDYFILLVAKPGEDYERFNPSINKPVFKD